jgi:hypothetical protein
MSSAYGVASRRPDGLRDTLSQRPFNPDSPRTLKGSYQRSGADLHARDCLRRMESWTSKMVNGR